MSMVQSVIFNKKYWDIVSAMTWLIEHKFKIVKVDRKKNYLRFRQENPKKFVRYFTKDLQNGIQLIIGFTHI